MNAFQLLLFSSHSLFVAWYFQKDYFSFSINPPRSLFSTNGCLDLAFVRFCVYDEDLFTKDDFIAQATFPFSSIRQGTTINRILLFKICFHFLPSLLVMDFISLGYSHIRLRTEGEKLVHNATLFVCTTITQEGMLTRFFFFEKAHSF